MSKLNSSADDSHDVDLAGSAVRGSVALSLQWFLNKLCSAGSTILIAYFLDPAEYGVARTALSLVVFLALPPLVMGDVLVARSRRMSYWTASARHISLQIACGSALLTIGALPLALRLVDTHDPQWFGVLIGILALRPILQSLRVVPLSILRHQLRFRHLAVVDGTIQLGATAASVVLAAVGAGPAAIVIPQMAAEAAAAWFYLRIAVVTPSSTAARRGVRALRCTYLTGAFAEYVHGVVMNVPMLAVVYLAGDYEAGIFAFAFMLAIQANAIILGRLGVILQPILGRLVRERARQTDGFVRSTRLLGAVSVPASVLQAILAEPIFRLVLHPKWQPALVAFQALSLMQGFYFAVAPSMACLKAQRRFRALLVWQAIHLVLSVPLYWLAVTFRGATGAAGMTALLWAASALAGVWMCVKFGRRGRFGDALSIFWKPWIRAAPLFASGYLAVRWLSRFQAFGDVLAVAAVGPIVLAVALVIARHAEPDVRTIVDRGTGWMKRLLRRA